MQFGKKKAAVSFAASLKRRNKNHLGMLVTCLQRIKLDGGDEFGGIFL